MKIFKSALLVMGILFAADSAQSANPGSALQIDDMPIACLPDRVTQDTNSACHCPPVDMCSEMPAMLALKCCPQAAEDKYCPASKITMPNTCSNGLKPDINGKCCPYAERKYVRFKHWHIRWREHANWINVRFLDPQGWSAGMPNYFPNYSNSNANWNRLYLAKLIIPVAPLQVGGLMILLPPGQTPLDVETGTLVGQYNGAPCVNGGTNYGNSNVNCGNLAAKICPIETENKSYTTNQYSMLATASQVCSIKNLNGTAAKFAGSMYENYYLTNPAAYTVSNCCVYEIPTEASCVAPDTLVIMADGSEKAIQKIVKGDVVKGQTRNNTVLDIVILTLDKRDMYSINGGVLKLTAEHPIMTSEGWKSVNGNAADAKAKYNLNEVSKLEIGDNIITSHGPVKLETLDKLPLEKDTTTFNLKLDGDETFHAGSIIVKDN